MPVDKGEDMNIDKLIERVEDSNDARDELRKIRDRINEVLGDVHFCPPCTLPHYSGTPWMTPQRWPNEVWCNTSSVAPDNPSWLPQITEIMSQQ